MAGSAGWCARCWGCSAVPSAPARTGAGARRLRPGPAEPAGAAARRDGAGGPGLWAGAAASAGCLCPSPRRDIGAGAGGGVLLRWQLGGRRAGHVPLRRRRAGRARHPDPGARLPPVSRGPLPRLHGGRRRRRRLGTVVRADAGRGSGTAVPDGAFRRRADRHAAGAGRRAICARRAWRAGASPE